MHGPGEVIINVLRVSVEAVVLLSKYIVGNPSDPSVHSLHTTNFEFFCTLRGDMISDMHLLLWPTTQCGESLSLALTEAHV